jgi:predicted transport protein
MATKTSKEIEQEFVDSLKNMTGKDLSAWLSAIKLSGLEKRNDIIQWLKNEQALGHMNASLLTGIYMNKGQLVYGNEENLLENQLVKCEEMRPLLEYISEQIVKHFPDSQLIAKKTYISFTAKREFVAINVKPKEIRLGLDLGDLPFTEKIQKSKLTGPMARIAHMIILTDKSQLNNEVIELMKQSYSRVS